MQRFSKRLAPHALSGTPSWHARPSRANVSMTGDECGDLRVRAVLPVKRSVPSVRGQLWKHNVDCISYWVVSSSLCILQLGANYHSHRVFIVLAVVFCLYCGIGALYKRVRYGASGIECIPHIDLLRAVQNETARLCCPSWQRRASDRYRPLVDVSVRIYVVRCYVCNAKHQAGEDSDDVGIRLREEETTIDFMTS
jgi:hypothetical protein